MRKIYRWAICLMLLGLVTPSAVVWAQTPLARTATVSKAQAALTQASEEGRFAFVVFYKEDNPTVQKMLKIVHSGVQKRTTQAAVVYVQVTDRSEQVLVERFEASRAPMPLTIAVAPNGAVTGVFSKEISDDNLDEAIVTPTMTRCMKSLQEDKMVFVCVQTSDKIVITKAVKEIQADPQFKDRVTVVTMRLNDPQEVRFLNQMEINPRTTTGVTAVLLAPPGLLIGKYATSATSGEIAAALHKAGKCCDDENCKHNHGSAQKPAQPTTTRRK